jgi:CPA2 family monovalent cation:H+ antiporter-2
MIASPKAADPELEARPSEVERHAIVVGYGRVGKVVCSLLERHGVTYVAADEDAAAVARDRRQGHKVYYGDAADPAFLRVLGLMQTPGVIITINVPETIDAIVAHVRELRPDVVIVARARDAEHASHLYAIGATDAVPETIEASLQLSEAALIGLGAMTGPVIASIHEKRDEFRHALQAAAKAVGREEIRAVRPKTSRSP